MEKVKRRIGFVLKIVISSVILVFIYSKIDMKMFWGNITQLSLFTISILLITSILKHITQGVNWYYALSINPKYKPTTYDIIKSYLIGISLGFVLPGGYATYGKMYFIENSKKATFFSVLIEKFFQTWGNLFYASIATVFYFTKMAISLRLLIAFVVTFSPLVLLLIVYLIPKYRVHIPILKKIFPKIIISQMIYIPLTVVQYWLILKSFTDITFIQSCISTTLILSSNVIPITFSGLGLREYFAIKVLAQYGITNTSAVTAALIIFFINSVLPALIGVVYIVRHKKIK
jgi:uncharacterized membrane protein YbhN (UPF0104 family)